MHITIGLATPVALLIVVLRDRANVDAGSDALSHADPGWLVFAAVAVTLTWVAAACGQLGATSVSLPPGRMVATQIAGSFVNHVLPAGFGGAAMTLRMMRRCGVTNLRATQAIGLNLGAGVVVHLMSLVLVLAIAGAAGGPGGIGPGALVLIAVAVCGAAGLGGLVWRWAARHETATAHRIRDVVADSKSALRNPKKAAMLWAGSVALPVLHILILNAVVQALDQPIPLVTIAGVYLAASTVAALVPSPGGFGSLDVALLAAFTGAGTGSGTATAAVVGYRLLTVWIPMIPSAATLLILLRRRVV